jgi:pSer/pThr/pTyr-binding forkhead associated (FHA) protein
MSQTVTLRVIQGELLGKTYKFSEPGMCVVGRSKDCQLQLPNNLLYQDVSRRHCVLEIEPPEIHLRDLGSRNGTFVNGTLIGRRQSDRNPDTVHTQEVKECALHDADEIRVGGTVFKVCVSPGEGHQDANSIRSCP